jgi:hypothetical protein
MDDSYPNDGSYFQPTEPEDQARQRDMQATKAQAAKPMLEDIIQQVTDDIERMKSVDAITVDPEASPEAFMKAWYGVQQQKAYAEQHKAYLESLLTITH